MIPSTKPYLPAVEHYQRYCREIWQCGHITNDGPLLLELEEKISESLNGAWVSFVSSGTMALQLMLRNLPRGSEVITTPFSYVATAGAISWEGLKPVFADIERHRLTIDPAQVQAALTEHTSAILATHIYGNACDVQALRQLADSHGVKLLFDGAHAFGSRYQGQPLLCYGDQSALSTHATKLYHTVNGGFVISHSAAEKEKIDRMRNFGHHGPNTFDLLGINGKNSEFHAAMGLCLFQMAEDLVQQRRRQWRYYYEALSGGKYQLLERSEEHGHNGAYFPVLTADESALQKLLARASAAQIHLRRYFYPSLNTLDFLNPRSCPVSEWVSERVCCLPLYHEMTAAEQDRVIALL